MSADAPQTQWPIRGLDLLPLGIAAFMTYRVVAAFAARVGHPYDLEWMEGGMLAHAWRLAEGFGLYVAPNPDFIPYIYPPGYSALLAALSPVFGLDYPVGRVLSVIGTLAAAGAIVFIPVRFSRGWVGGLCGAALYLGLFRASGGFYDLVRPDAIGVALVAWSVAFALERWRGAEVVSGLLLCGAFLFKHNFAAFGVPLLAGLALRGGWPVALRFVGASAGPALLFTLGLQVASGGHFLTYLLGVPRSHPMLWGRFLTGFEGELAVWLLPTLLLGAGWLVFRARISRWSSGLMVLGVGLALGIPGALAPVLPRMDMGSSFGVGAALFAIGTALGAGGVVAAQAVRRLRGHEVEMPGWRWVLAAGVTGCAFLLAGFMRAHHGGFLNVLMPAHWVTALGLAVVVEDARRQPWEVRPLVHGATMLFLVFQLGWVNRRLDTEEVIPPPEVVEAGAAVEATLAELCPEGRIFAPQFAWLPTRVGRPPSMPLISLWDIYHESGPYFEGSKSTMEMATREHYWSCVLQASQAIGFGVDKHYIRARRLTALGMKLRPMTGWRVRPLDVLVPRKTKR